VFWLVGGVWAVRRAWGRPPGLGWGIAVLGAGLRWGTLSVGGVQAATRLLGPTVAVGPAPAAVGAWLALAAALLDAAADDGLRARAVPLRAATVLAILALVPLYCVPGAGEPSLGASLGWWVAASGVLAALVLWGASAARRVPRWVAPSVAAAGVLAMGFGR
jgi:hypothetical protein